jgi:hypothetical protein
MGEQAFICVAKCNGGSSGISPRSGHPSSRPATRQKTDAAADGQMDQQVGQVLHPRWFALPGELAEIPAAQSHACACEDKNDKQLHELINASAVKPARKLKQSF